MKNPGVAGVIVFLFVLFILSAGCISPPRENPGSGVSPGNGASVTQSSSQTPKIIDTQFLTPATPYPTGTATAVPTYIVSPEVTEIPLTYQAIYYNHLNFNFNTSAYSYSLENPPLIMDICLKPEMITRNIWYESRYTSRGDVYTTQTSISPSSFFEIRVRDLITGEVILEDGFGKTFSVDTRKKIYIRSAGDYLIEFTGNDITATIQMTIPMPPNSTATPAVALSCAS